MHRQAERAGAVIPQKTRLWGDFIVAFQYVKDAYNKDEEKFFTGACADRTRGNVFKIKEGRFRLGIQKKFFHVRVVSLWHRLSRDVSAPSLEMFKCSFD